MNLFAVVCGMFIAVKLILKGEKVNIGFCVIYEKCLQSLCNSYNNARIAEQMYFIKTIKKPLTLGCLDDTIIEH